ncbi:unnamed protein product [Rotaria sp. Silwood2]|nr:unnamed protein product [Rotaria sp. Silwood2]CAF4618588.1 unnamed protein product [Rotaria sp. Silwood2]
MDGSLLSLFECDIAGGLVCKQQLKNDLITYMINISHIHINNICQLVIECQSSLLLKNFRKPINDQDEINSYDTNRGFLIFQWSIDHLKKLLSTSRSLLLCVIDYNKNKFAGYQLLLSLTGLFQYMDSTYSHIEFDPTKTGVSLEYQGLGIASSLITLAKSHSIDGLRTNITYWPYNNIASEECKSKNGFECISIWHQTICEHFVPFKAKIFIWRPIKSDLS